MRSRLALLTVVAAVVGAILGFTAPPRLVLAIVAAVVLALPVAGAIALKALAARLRTIQVGVEAARRLASNRRPKRGGKKPKAEPPTPRTPAEATRRVVRDATVRGAELLDGLTFDGARPHVVLMLQAFEPDLVFAGVRTTVLTSARLAGRMGLPLRVMVINPTKATHAECRASLVDLVREHSGHPALADSLLLSTDASRSPEGHHPSDVWVATYWTTAYALALLARSGRVNPRCVVYLVQDFEPGFYPWGPLYAKALSTYGAGFRLMVNSRSLASYVEDQTRVAVNPANVFAPALDPAPLRRAAEGWRPAEDGEVRVLFYARPSKPRNMHAVGVEALCQWAEALPDGVRAVVRFAGEGDVEPVDLGPRVRVELLGKLSYDAYYDVLADTDVGLALMLSPHPGHLALELPMAGIPTVTNDFAGYRHAWVEGLELCDPEPASVAEALLAATARARVLTSHVPGRVVGDLGAGLDAAVDHMAAELSGS